MSGRDVIVIGASRGGTDPLVKIVADLPRDLPATVFIARHVPPDSPGYLEAILNRAGSLPICVATDGIRFSTGCIYIAPPDLHLLLQDGHLRLIRGPRENRARPAIDALFRSAAVSSGPRVIAVLLSGLMSDGTSGMEAVKRCGGLAVVQDPEDAAFPEMPENALLRVEADYCLPADQIGPTLVALAGEPAGDAPPVPPEIAIEARIAGNSVQPGGGANLPGVQVPYGCPDCGGPLRQIEDGAVQRYRCRVGHGYNADALAASMTESGETALWAAMRTMEERAELLDRLCHDSERKGRAQVAELYRERARQARQQALDIRAILMQGEKAG